MKSWRFGAGIAVGVLGALSGGSALGLVSVPYTYGVSSSGSATIEVPIKVPPGLGGIAPSLSLTYDSSKGNGPLGVGWSLSGLSAIARCPQTLSQHGVHRWIAIDALDRYCLDGEMLSAVSDPAAPTGAMGTYGAANTYYATERDGFSRIQSIAVTGVTGGAGAFIVKTKAGLTMEYGRTVDSRILLQGTTVPRQWSVNRISDSTGNYMDFEYTLDSANGQQYPARITYTKNARATPVLNGHYQVVFEYPGTTRSDPQRLYRVGKPVITNKLLSGIHIHVNGSVSSSYKLTYATEAGLSSRLVKIEHSAGSASLMPLTLQWQLPDSIPLVDRGPAISSTPYAAWAGPSAAGRIHPMDLNDDGRTDVLIGPDGGGRWFWMRSTGSGLQDMGQLAIPAAYGAWHQAAERIRRMDVNGDGRVDLVIGPDQNGSWWWMRNTGAGVVDGGSLVSGKYAQWAGAPARVRPIDVDGDGRQDLLIGPAASGQWFWLRSAVPASNPNGASFEDRGPFATTQYGGWDNAEDRTRVIDVDGDGMQDIVFGPAAANWYWLRGQPSGLQDRLSAISGDFAIWSGYGSVICPIPPVIVPVRGILPGATWRPSNLIRAADVTGDGLQDLVLGPSCVDGTWRVLEGTGAGFRDAGVWGSGFKEFVVNAAQIRVIDSNIDNMADFVMGPKPDGTWYRMKSTGNALVAETTPFMTGKYGAWHGAAERIRPADLNGDGVDDLLIGPDAAGNWYWLEVNSRARVITRADATNGHNPVEFRYGRLSDPTIYTRGTGAVYPVADLSPTTLVVKELVVGSGVVGGVTSDAYTYGGMRVGHGVLGRGLMGFEWMQTRQLQSGLVTRTTFRQDFPFTGLPARVTKGTSALTSANLQVTATRYDVLCKTTQHAPTFGCAPAPGLRYHVYAKQVDDTGKDLNGSGLPGRRVTTTIDALGSPTRIDDIVLTPAGAPSGHSISTVNVYRHDLSLWHLGRLLRTTTTSTSP